MEHVDMAIAFLVYILIFLIPINGLFLLAMIRERKAMRATLRGLWRLYNGRN